MVNCRAGECVGWFPHNAAAGEVSFVPFPYLLCQQQGVDASFITREVGKIPVGFGKARSMTLSKAHCAAEATAVQLDEPIPLHSDNISKGGDDGDGGHVEPIWDPQHLIDQYAGGVSAL